MALSATCAFWRFCVTTTHRRIEEPELGLHPDMMPTLAAARGVDPLPIVTRTSSWTVTEEPDSVIVCEKRHDVRRLDSEALGWLRQYSLGELAGREPLVSRHLRGGRWRREQGAEGRMPPSFQGIFEKAGLAGRLPASSRAVAGSRRTTISVSPSTISGTVTSSHCDSEAPITARRTRQGDGWARPRSDGRAHLTVYGGVVLADADAPRFGKPLFPVEC